MDTERERGRNVFLSKLALLAVGTCRGESECRQWKFEEIVEIAGLFACDRLETLKEGKKRIEVEFGGIGGIAGVFGWNLVEQELEDSWCNVFFCRLDFSELW